MIQTDCGTYFHYEHGKRYGKECSTECEHCVSVGDGNYYCDVDANIQILELLKRLPVADPHRMSSQTIEKAVIR